NGIDDDCDGDIDELPACGCATEADNLSAADLVAAMDLCDPTIVDMDKTGNVAQFGVYPDYFGDIQPENGDCLTVMSTGRAGGTEVTGGSSAEPNDFCPGSSGCGLSGSGCARDPDPEGDGDDVCDLAKIELVLKPPPNAKGFEFQFMFLSAEWPEWLCQSYNDTFY